MTVLPRHIKLELARREKKWVYAVYELLQPDEAFDRCRSCGRSGVRIVEMIETIIRQPMYGLGPAIKEKNIANYATAYGS